MTDPQVIRIGGILDDAALVVWGEYVIKDSGTGEQDPIVTPTTLTVDLDIYNVTTGAFVMTVSSASMTYDTNSKFWSILLNTGTPTLNGGTVFMDRNKYVARVSETAVIAGMREFSLEEFSVEKESFEDALMRMPFEVFAPAALGGNMYFVWYDTDAHQQIVDVTTRLTYAKYKAPAYEGGSGTTYATDASRVTHRGAIVAY